MKVLAKVAIGKMPAANKPTDREWLLQLATEFERLQVQNYECITINQRESRVMTRKLREIAERMPND